MCTLSKFATQQAENGQTGALLLSAPVAQLDRASDCGSEGRTFKSCRAHHKKQQLRLLFFVVRPEQANNLAMLFFQILPNSATLR